MNYQPYFCPLLDEGAPRPLYQRPSSAGLRAPARVAEGRRWESRVGPGRPSLPPVEMPPRSGSEGGMAPALPERRRTALFPPGKTTLTRRQEAAGPAGTNQAGPGREGGGGRGDAAGGEGGRAGPAVRGADGGGRPPRWRGPARRLRRAGR